jgi:multiple sugar transport system permease protein
MLPMMLSPAVVGCSEAASIRPSGSSTTSLAGKFEWLADQMALWAVAMVDVWMWSPFVMLCHGRLSAVLTSFTRRRKSTAPGHPTPSSITLPLVARS